MVKLIFVVVYFLSSCFAQDLDKVIEYDFGKVASATIVNSDFELQEQTKSVTSLCECLKVQLKEYQDKQMIQIEFNSLGYQGQFQQEILLVNKDDKVVRLKIKAFIE